MTDPHAILGISPQASDDELRARYLDLVREFPPDRAPEKFAEIRAAYDQARDPVRRLEGELFHWVSRDSLEALRDDLRARLVKAPLDSKALLSLAEASWTT